MPDDVVAQPFSVPSSATERLFDGPGVMRARCRSFDWARTSLGPVSGWSLSLRTIVGMMLAARHPMFLWWGPDLVQIYNDGYLPSFGTTGRDVSALGATGEQHWNEIWPVIGPQIRQVLKTGDATWHEDQLVPIDRNGRLEEVWWTYGYSPAFDDDGSIAGVLVVVQETTARVKAVAALEAARGAAELALKRLSDVFRQAPAFIAVMRGPKFVFEVVNDAYYQLVGHREILGKGVFEALPEGRGQGFEELLTGVLETGETYAGTEIPVTLQRTPDAPPEQRYLNLMYQAITGADGATSGIFALGVDVTDQVRARRDVEAARHDADSARFAAEEANRAKSEFLAVMSHELRTPLNAIGGYADLIQMGIHGPVTEAQRSSLSRIQQSQRHLLGLINEVLNHTRIERGSVHYDLTTLSVQTAVKLATALVMPQAQTKGLGFEQADSPRGTELVADAEKLRQVLLNVLTNAVKFTEPGGTITIGWRLAGNQVAIEVADTGIGIEPEKIETIFEPFVQVNQRLTRPNEGIGLGLAISRDLARGMGGDLVVASERGSGSTFTLMLPSA
ncbi:MAG: ATP-binding protein [Gemmatimonadaceae bacterium]